jgi:hypothetical protein
MAIRRVILWALSGLAGLAGAAGIITAFGTTLEKFSPLNAVVVVFGLGGLTFIWLDYLLKTDYLRS